MATSAAVAVAGSGVGFGSISQVIGAVVRIFPLIASQMLMILAVL